MTRQGFVLPALLGTLLVIGVISFAMSLVATLESLSARSAAGAVEARALVDAAMALALASLSEQASAGAVPDLDGAPYPVYGPWLAAGIDAVATLSRAATDVTAAEGVTSEGPALDVYRLDVDVNTGRARAVGKLVFRLEPALTILERRRP